ncbi:MAG: hypothetical protein AAGF06_05025 [Pseudomonadota bacterium]
MKIHTQNSTILNALALFGLLSASNLGHAGAYDSSGHPYDSIFDEGLSATYSYLNLNPERTVKATQKFGDEEYTAHNPLKAYERHYLAIKADLSTRLACMLQYDPTTYSVRSDYGDQLPLGAKRTSLKGSENTALCSFALNQDKDSLFKVMLGAAQRDFNLAISQDTSSQAMTLGGLAGIPGITLPSFINSALLPLKLQSDLAIDLKGSTEIVPRIGVSYEKPSLNIRAALMYTGKSTHDMKGTFTEPVFNTSHNGYTELLLPETYDVSLRTGISKKWQMGMAFGYVLSKWGDLPSIAVSQDSPVPITLNVRMFDKHIATKYVGIGKKFNDKFSLGGRFMWEGDRYGRGGGVRGATDGRQTIVVGGEYKVTDQLTVSPRVAFTKLEESKHTDYFMDIESDGHSYSRTYGVQMKYRFK